MKSKDPWDGIHWHRVLRGALIATGGALWILVFAGILPLSEGWQVRAIVVGLGLIVWGAFDLIFGLAGRQGVW